MATAKRAFQRKTGAETLVAIIREEPEPIAQLAPKSPAPVRWIVERLLAKDPEERYASTKDLARDLKSVRDHLSETSASGALAAAEPVRAQAARVAGSGASALSAGAGRRRSSPQRLASRPDCSSASSGSRTRRVAPRSARFAPDGQTSSTERVVGGRPVEVYSTARPTARSPGPSD
jgi:hypothetical protein